MTTPRSVVEDVARIRSHPLVNKSIPDLRLHLRREERPPDRGAGGERGRQRRFRCAGKTRQDGQGFDQTAEAQRRCGQGAEARQSDCGCAEQRPKADQSDQGRCGQRTKVRQDQSSLTRPACAPSPGSERGHPSVRSSHGAPAPDTGRAGACASVRPKRNPPRMLSNPRRVCTLMATLTSGRRASRSVIERCHVLFGHKHSAARWGEHHGTRRG